MYSLHFLDNVQFLTSNYCFICDFVSEDPNWFSLISLSRQIVVTLSNISYLGIIVISAAIHLHYVAIISGCFA